jgi:hypothetical protein
MWLTGACLIQFSAIMGQFSEPVRNEPVEPIKMGQCAYGPKLVLIISLYSSRWKMPAPGSGSYRAFLQNLKSELYTDYQPTGEVRSADGEVPCT